MTDPKDEPTGYALKLLEPGRSLDVQAILQRREREMAEAFFFHHALRNADSLTGMEALAAAEDRALERLSTLQDWKRPTPLVMHVDTYKAMMRNPDILSALGIRLLPQKPRKRRGKGHRLTRHKALARRNRRK